MPELPEVETIAIRLRDGQASQPSLLGKTIKRAEVYWDKTVAEPGAKEFIQRIKGQRIESIGRRAKFIQFLLSRDTMLIHLRMSGDVLVGEGKNPSGKHSRMALIFDDGWHLSFNNPRKFGRVYLVPELEVFLGHLGPEPFDEALTPSRFFIMLQERKRQIKPLLLDQEFLAGMGNIYTDEALNVAKIHPLAKANTLTKVQAKNLLNAIRTVLADGIRRNGASIDWVYRGGEFQNYFRVYQRTGKPCLRCGTPIVRTVVGQRGTHYCPKCQPDPQIVKDI